MKVLDAVIAQLIEHRSSNVKVIGSFPVEAWSFFRVTIKLLKLCYNWENNIFQLQVFVNLHHLIYTYS